LRPVEYRAMKRLPLPSYFRSCFPLLLAAIPILILPRPVSAQSSAPVSARIEMALGVPVLKNAIVGALIRSLDDGRVIYQRNPDTALMPASNNKLLTAAAALSLLGSNYRYTTTLYRVGEIGADGTFSGDLYLKGTGDPSFTSTDLANLAKALKAAGVTAFTGRIIADESKFDEERLADGWGWDNEPFDYQPQISALTCDENVIAVRVQPGANPGDPAVVTLGGDKADALGFTGTNYVSVRNAVTTVGTDAKPETPPTFNRARAQNLILVSGEISVGASPVNESITVEDPALFTANRLWELLPIVGITIPAETRRIGKGIVPTDAMLVASHQSDTMANLLPLFLKPSDNLYGECFLKTIGAEKAGKGTWDDGAKVVKAFLMNAGINVSGLYMRDGSGLTRKDNVTARTLVELLTFIDRSFPAQQRKAFYDALPIGGKEDDYVGGHPSTLRLRYRGTPLAGKVRAKTGSLDGVSGLSGYVTTPGGKRYVFSLLMNHFSGGGTTSQVRAAQDAVILSLP